MNITDLESFVVVVETGSIVAAASNLHLTQSAISKRLQNLEDALGVSLLDRQKRPMQLTPAGKATYTAAKPVLCSVEGLRSSLNHDGEPSGDFSFGVARSLGGDAIVEPIKALRTHFPLLQLHAYSLWSDVLMERVRSGSLEAAVVLLPDGISPDSDIEGEYLGRHSSVLVAARSMPLPRRARLQDLPEKSWIVGQRGCAMRASVEFALAKQRLSFGVAVEVDGKDLQMELAAAIQGVCVVPERTFLKSPHRKNLRVIHLEDFEPAQDLWLIQSKHLGHLTKCVHNLREIILQFTEKPARNKKEGSA